MSSAPDGLVQRWQQEVARDPGSPAFIHLADHYRTRGRFDIARRVCTRGLERQPENVEAHYLLGRIYRDLGDLEKAGDEWDIALRLDESHVAARRSVGLLRLEQGKRGAAEDHLKKALQNDPDDPRIRRALVNSEKKDGGQPLSGRYWSAVANHLQEPLARFARESRVRFALMIDSSGRILAREGATPRLDLASFASLAAATHAAGQEMARMIGEAGFSQLYQGRESHQIFLGAIRVPHGEILLLAAFDEATNIGLVRTLFRDLPQAVTHSWPEPEKAPREESLEAALAAALARIRAIHSATPSGGA